MDDDVRSRFWSRVAKGPGCWEWTGGALPSGYGRLAVHGKDERAHRVSWLIHFGEIGSLHVLHRCDNPRCVNPEHLFLGTHADNMRDKATKGRCVNRPRRGERVATAKLSAKQVPLIRSEYERGVRLETIAERYGISRPNAWLVATRRTWRHV